MPISVVPCKRTGILAYDMYENKSGVLTLICWAHVRRYFVKALNNDKARAEYALQEIGLLYEIERKADDEQMDYNQREQLRLIWPCQYFMPLRSG